MRGLLIVLGWPHNSFLVLGIVLDHDLLPDGIPWIIGGVGLGAHQPLQ